MLNQLSLLDLSMEEHALNLLTSREKKALLENLRSDFSTPLDVIVGYSEILGEELANSQAMGSEKSRADIKKVLEGGKTILKHVDEAFDLASLSTKQVDFDLSKFLSNLRHTLLTPLNSIIGYSELLFEEGFADIYGEQLTHDLQKIYEAAKVFIGYINKISVFAKTQFEGGDLLQHFKSLSTVIRQVLTSIPPLEQKFELQPSKQGTVLIVDDNKMELDLLMRRVEYYGYTAIPCDTGNKAIDMLKAGHYDLVLLQIIMAEVNGFEVLKQIKRNEAFRHLPIIVISPLKELDAVVRCFELGADDYLPKPFHSVIFKARVNDCIEKKKLLDRESEYFNKLKLEKEKSEKLLLNILPDAIVERLKKGEEFIADKADASILFADIVNFSGLAERLNAQELIELLNKVFSIIDRLIDKYEVEKIKTVGDNYMAVAGVPTANKQHAEAVAHVALEILDAIEKLNREQNYSLKLRIGINSGSVVAGIIGKKKFIYDLWGKTVNLASRMESQGVGNKIQVTEMTYQLLKNKFNFRKRGTIQVRGVGEIVTYFLTGPKKQKIKDKRIPAKKEKISKREKNKSDKIWNIFD